MRQCGIVLPGLRAAANILGTVVAVLATTALFSSANAAPVTLVATGSVHMSYPQWIPGHEGAVLRFTYDDQTLDSNPDPLHGLYENPFLSGTFDFGDSHFVFDVSSPSQILLRVDRPAGSNVFLNARMIGARGEVSDLRFVMEAMWNQGSTDLLSTFPYIRCSEICLSLLTVSLGEESSEYHFHMEPREFSVVPIPPAVWLFGSALGLMGVMRRKLAR
jgi:hypothetical protein